MARRPDMLMHMDTDRLSAAATALPPDSPEPRKPARSWREKFKDAFRGIKSGIRGQSSFFVHFFFAALVVAAAIVLGCGPISWAVLLFCIGFVLTAELFNSAIEALFHGLDERAKARSYRCLDIAAGGVLFASITVAVVGGFIFLYKLAEILWPESVPHFPGW